MKVPHIDREVSFGNRHSKISGPKDFLQKIANHRTLRQSLRIISILSMQLTQGPAKPHDTTSLANGHQEGPKQRHADGNP